MTSVDLAWQALRDYVREPGRSVAVRVEIDELQWQAEIAANVARPAASLLKLPLAMAAEEVLCANSGDPRAAQACVTVGQLLAGWREPSVLNALDPERALNAAELIRLAVSSSDGAAAQWLLGSVGIEAVVECVSRIGASNTQVFHTPGAPGGALTGYTTAGDALTMLAAALDQSRYPVVASALRASTLNSRIPLGVNSADVAVAHKTGTLFGVAHDVALLEVAARSDRVEPGGVEAAEGPQRVGQVWLAFLTDSQHDTLVTGYEMGLCTQQLLAAFGVGVTATRSVIGAPARL